ncbi:MAG: ammonium transporter [Gammaproteobacteria bacterium]|nr:ammonium transporter [Gammaproteobacteria bacterium]
MKKPFTLIALLATLPLSNANAADTATLTLNMDTVWVAIAAALVFFMQAGFALLESGMSRAKNSVNVIMKNYVDACVGSLVYWLVGFGIMFGINHSGWFGEDHFFVNVADDFDYTFLMFQTMFAATAVTIASGAMAERTHYRAYLLGAVIITAIIYPVYGSWAWGGAYGGSGWLADMGFIDFAGSTVVHSVGGWVALAGILVLGPRMGRFSNDGRAHPIPGHNLTSVALGGFILWLGWFGFNGGSTVAASANIGLINLNTHLSAAAGAVGALLALMAIRAPIYMTTVINGSIAGLVAITAGAATMTPPFAIITGLVGGVVVVAGERLLYLLRLDDVVGAVSVHGFAGVWGTLAAGIFKHGDMFNSTQILIQFIGISAAFLWTFPVALLMYYLLDKTVGLRADSISEQRGLDFAEHYEIGYPEFQLEKLHEKRG